MKYLYVSLLCLVLCQCKKGGSEIGPAPDSIDNGSKTTFKSEPTLISAWNSLGWDVVVDDSNNVYVTGTFYGTNPFGTAVGSQDVFLAKYKPSGELIWSKTLGGPRYDEGRSIDIDRSGNVYITGDFYGTLSLGDQSVTSHGDADAFIAKFNSNGDLQWMRNYGSDGGERGHALAVDGNGNVYATGEFQGTGIFENIRQQSNGEFDAFIVKYNTDGQFQWVQSGGGAGRDTGYGIAADVRTGDVYLTGFFIGTTTFGNASATSTGELSGEGDVFLAKYNTEGVCQWLRASGGRVPRGGFDAAVDGLGNVFMLIRDSSEEFLGKYDANGVSQWRQLLKFGGDGVGVTADKVGNAYVVTSGSAILKYNAGGVLQQAQIPRSTDHLSGMGISVNRNGKLFVTGHYRGTITFGGISKNDGGGLNMFAIGGNL